MIEPMALVLAAAGVASAAYGASRALCGVVRRFYCIWFVLAVVLVLPSLLMAAGLWETVPLGLRWAAELMLGLLLVYECVLCALVWRHAHDTAPQDLDWILVLGARVEDGVPGRTFARRLDAAHAYLVANPRTRCVVCGGQGSDETVSEARAGTDYLLARGIDGGRVLLEDKSRSTTQNLGNAAEFVEAKGETVGVVTSNYHVARSLAIARKAGMRHVYGIAVKSAEPLPLNDMVRESFAWAKDVLAGNA